MVAAVVAVLLISGTAQRVQAQVESLLHSFAGSPSDGAIPNYTTLLRDPTGNLYGTTGAGGSSTNCATNGCGTVFELSPDPSSSTGYKEAVLHNFAGGPGDGANPEAGLVADSAGNLYGTTFNGGSSTNCGTNGCGTVFKLSPDSSSATGYKETVLYNFTGATASDGQQPLAGLVMDSSGNLYGTTVQGGSTANLCGTTGCGTVFQLSPDSSSATGYKETVLHLFKGYNSTTPAASDGVNPRGDLVLDSSGNLYGTTSSGGSSDSGTVFELTYDSSTSSYTEKVLYSFMGGTGDGGNPRADLTLDSSGNLYGTTFYGGPSTNCGTFGCGTVFELAYDSSSSSYTEKVLQNFAGGTGDGAQPYAGLVIDSAGNLYGATSGGGSSTNCGTSGCGTVFELSPPATAGGNWQETVLYNFAGQTDGDGSFPAATPTLDAAGNLYGATSYGGSSTNCGTPGCGAVYGIAPVTLSASSLSFGNVAIGSSSAVQSVTVTNIGDGQFSYSTASISGADASDFSVTNGCSAAVAHNSTCTVSVAFTPSTATAETATLDLTQAGLTQTVTLTGTGVYPTASLSASSLTFSSQDVGATSSAQTVTVTNTGTVPLTVTSVGITGDFAIASNNCSTVAAGENCAVGVTFTATAAGTRTGTLSFKDDASDSPQTVSLTGQGQDFALTARTTSQTVAPGGTATYDLQLMPEGGFSQEVTTACSGAPKGTTCTVMPASVTLDGTSNASISVKVATTAVSMVGPGSGNFVPPPSGSLPLVAWQALFGLLGLLAVANFSPKGRGVRTLASFATLALLVSLWAACGSGSSTMTTARNSNATPAGTYTLTVTSTSASLSQSAQLTLTVQ